MSELKKVGLFGSVSNGVKGVASAVEGVALSVDEAVSFGLLKIQLEGINSLEDEGFSVKVDSDLGKSLDKYKEILEVSRAAARKTYK